MTQKAASHAQTLMAGVALALIIALITVGLLWHGISADVQERFWRDFSDRFYGPMRLRFLLQPCMAAFVAMHDGIEDARQRRTPYLRSFVDEPAGRRERLSEGLLAVGRILLLGLGMDTIYQFYVLKTFYPGETALIAILFAFVPYLLLRGPFARIARLWLSRKSTKSAP